MKYKKSGVRASVYVIITGDVRVCTGVHAGACAMEHMWKSEDSLQFSALLPWVPGSKLTELSHQLLFLFIFTCFVVAVVVFLFKIGLVVSPG